LQRAHAAGWRETREEWRGPWPRRQDAAVVVTVRQLRRNDRVMGS
jgi:hypothetical protein